MTVTPFKRKRLHGWVKGPYGVTSVTSPLLSIIVLNWNGARYLPHLFQSLHDQSFRDFEVIMVDNASTDASLAATKAHFPEVRLLELAENGGFAEPNNMAVDLATAPFLLFLNNDTYLNHDTLTAIAHAVQTQSKTSIWAVQFRSYDGSQLLGFGNAVDVLGFPTSGKLFFSVGAALVMRRDAFQRLGGFDPHYFMYFEEIDLCWRAWLHGYHIATIPRAIVYHEAGGSSGSPLMQADSYRTTKFRRRLGHRNQIATILKNYSAPVLPFALLLFGSLAAAEAMLLMMTGQKSVITEAYMPAWRDLWRDRAHIYEERKKVQAARVVSDWAILRRMEWRLHVVSLFFRTGVPKIK